MREKAAEHQESKVMEQTTEARSKNNKKRNVLWLRWEDSGKEEGMDGNWGSKVKVVQFQIMVPVVIMTFEKGKL